MTESIELKQAGDLTVTRRYFELERVHEKEAQAYNNVLELFGEEPETTDDFYEDFVDEQKKEFESA